MKFEVTDLVRAARRDNNTKRPYLLVNPSQGKHVPVQPHTALTVFGALGDLVRAAIPADEPVLVIAFAETATAIGAAIAAALPGTVYLMQTTREAVPDTDFLYFSETHSHATEQRLCTRGLDAVLSQVRHIVFAEDEVTTGNTILHLIDALRARYALDGVTFGVASLLSGMTAESRETYQKAGIWTRYLLKTDNAALAETAAQFTADGPRMAVSHHHTLTPQRVPAPGWTDMRCVGAAQDYLTACGTLARQAVPCIPDTAERVLVLGTEECMYPGLMTGLVLERAGYDVRFHATTRSPILTDSHPDYPLHARWELRSLYDADRVTYLYNLQAYDHVCIVTDAQNPDTGLDTLLSALEQTGNHSVTVLEWRRA